MCITSFEKSQSRPQEESFPSRCALKQQVAVQFRLGNASFRFGRPSKTDLPLLSVPSPSILLMFSEPHSTTVQMP